jgi:beta-catenin-like protein 1
LNEEEESDRQGVFLLLGIFENAVGLDPNLSRHIAKKTPSFDWLIGRLSAKEHDPNRGYAAELLSILLQTDSEARMWFGKDGRLEKLLLVVSVCAFVERKPD